jgi:hypothetical protein
MAGFDFWLHNAFGRRERQALAGPLPAAFEILELQFPILHGLFPSARRLLSLPASEASVERALWYRRRVLCPASRQSSAELLLNRSRMMMGGLPDTPEARSEIHRRHLARSRRVPTANEALHHGS